MTWRIEAPSAGTSPSPPVKRRNGVGTRTRTAIDKLYLPQTDLDAYSCLPAQTSAVADQADAAAGFPSPRRSNNVSNSRRRASMTNGRSIALETASRVL